VAYIMDGTGKDHGQHFQVCKLCGEVIIGEQTGQALHNVGCMGAVVVGILQI
jgi:hypothetical protein